MIYFKILIIISFAISQFLNGMIQFKSDKSCKKPLICTGSYDSKFFYSVKCVKLSCPAISQTHGFDCSPDHCADSEISCDLFLNLNKYMKLFKSDQYKYFKSHVKTCVNQRWNKLNADDVCLNGDGCVLKEQFIRKSGLFKF